LSGGRETQQKQERNRKDYNEKKFQEEKGGPGGAGLRQGGTTLKKPRVHSKRRDSVSAKHTERGRLPGDKRGKSVGKWIVKDQQNSKEENPNGRAKSEFYRVKKTCLGSTGQSQSFQSWRRKKSQRTGPLENLRKEKDSEGKSSANQ